MNAINNIKHLKIDLYSLKSYKDLEKTYNSFNNNLKKYFQKNKPIKKFFDFINCPICNSKKKKFIFKIDNFQYDECLNCSLIYNNPILKDKLYKDLYKVGTYKEYVKNLTEKGDKIRANYTEARKFKQINSLFKKKNLKMLDIGCGTGTLMSIFNKNKWTTLGIEPSEYSSKIAKRKNLDVKNIFFENYSEVTKFDVITLFGVLEHVTDPIRIIKKASKHIKKGGFLVFEIPSADSFIMKYIKSGLKINKLFRFIETSRHLTFFSIKSIEFICTKFNYDIKYFETNGLDLQTIINEEKNSNADFILNFQHILNNMNLADHYRFFLKKN